MPPRRAPARRARSSRESSSLPASVSAHCPSAHAVAPRRASADVARPRILSAPARRAGDRGRRSRTPRRLGMSSVRLPSWRKSVTRSSRCPPGSRTTVPLCTRISQYACCAVSVGGTSGLIGGRRQQGLQSGHEVGDTGQRNAPWSMADASPPSASPMRVPVSPCFLLLMPMGRFTTRP